MCLVEAVVWYRRKGCLCGPILRHHFPEIPTTQLRMWREEKGVVETETETETQRETETVRERQTETETHRERDIE